ncbi:MAG: hypothetical protein AB8G05_13975 [Oligoflexales bacterium]
MVRQRFKLLSILLILLIIGTFSYACKHASASVGTRIEIGWVWYDGELGTRTKKKLEGKLSSLGLFYPIPFVPSVHLGLNYSALNINKEVFITPPADASLETLGAEINFLYSVTSVLDFVFKVKQSLKSTGSYRFESPAEVVQFRATGSRVVIGAKYLLVPISKMIFGLAASREVFTEEGAQQQEFSSRSLHIGFELLF